MSVLLFSVLTYYLMAMTALEGPVSGIGTMVNGNMYVDIHEDNLVIRVVAEKGAVYSHLV